MVRSKKQFSRYMICAALVLLLGIAICFIGIGASAVTYAEELPQDGAEIVQEESSEPAEDPTFFGRIWEWTTEHATEILTVVGDIVLVAYLIAKNIKSKKRLVDLGKNLLTVKDGVSNTAHLQGNVVDVTNNLIAGYNRFEQSLNNFDATENERYKTMLAAFAQTKAILEILMTVYANSKNIPQGVKDLVNLKYAEVLKLVGDEKKLKEIAEPSKCAEETAEVCNNAEG